jgi:DNA-binding response OmpR family regulator
VLGTGQDALGYFLMIRATLRRKRPHVMTEVLQFGKLTLDQEKFVVSFEDRQAPLKMLEFCVLGAMLDAPRMVWSKVFLNRVVFGPVDVKPGRQFDTYMSLARRHIRDRIGVDPIVAEHGLGYALAPSVLGVPGIAAH